MKVELQNGDRIAIPEGCKAQINGNEIVVEKEGKSKDFKRGDILVSLSNEIILVDDYDFKGGHLYSFVNVDRSGQLYNEPYFQWNERHDWRLASDEEKQLLFDKMKEQGLRWNAEEKKVEKIRWRAKYGEEYWYVTSSCSVAGDFMREENSLTGEGAIEDWSGYNHFRKKAQAKEAAKRVKETLKKYCEEIGE
jgi:hypothetical protein